LLSFVLALATEDFDAAAKSDIPQGLKPSSLVLSGPAEQVAEKLDLNCI
jgi:hypothetical protein